MNHTLRFVEQCRSDVSRLAEPEGPARIVAITLARETARSLGASQDTEAELIDAAFLVGSWLAEEGMPGRWDRVDPRKVVSMVPTLHPRSREVFLESLIQLVGFAGGAGWIPVAAASEILRTIAGLAPDGDVRAFAQQTMREVGTCRFGTLA